MRLRVDQAGEFTPAQMDRLAALLPAFTASRKKDDVA